MGLRNVPERGLLAAFGVALSCLLGCGGKEFSSGAAGAGGGSGSGSQAGNVQGGSDGGGSEDGGAAGNVASGGTQSTAGKAGGGTSAVGCNCPAGNYCRDGSTDCFDCAELGRLRFRDPEKLATLSEGEGSRFPRVGATGTDLLYQFAGVGLRYTTDSSTSAGSSVAQTMPDDRAPLLLSSTVRTLPEETVKPFNFVFDRLVEETRRELYFGEWMSGLMSASSAPPPYNSPGTSNFGLAIALQGIPGTARAYWMTDRMSDVPLVLVTALLTLDTPGEVVTLNIGEPGCPASAEDLTPWVTPDGKTLFFSHTRKGPGCVDAGQGKDLYWSLMAPATGQPVNGESSAAVAFSDVNSPQDDVDPSFSSDFCELYFSSNRDGQDALYRAHRR